MHSPHAEVYDGSGAGPPQVADRTGQTSSSIQMVPDNTISAGDYTLNGIVILLLWSTECKVLTCIEYKYREETKEEMMD